jgi:hypothetical protein
MRVSEGGKDEQEQGQGAMHRRRADKCFHCG